MSTVLVIGPHPDDQELGMGGTIARFADQGHSIVLLDMTDGEPTPHGDPVTRAREAEEARRILDGGTGRVSRRLLGLKNREVEHTLEARHAVAGVIRAVQPEVMFVPHFEDAHPDHRAVTRIAEDARFDAKLTKVAMPGDEGRPPIYPRWLFYYYATHLRIVPDPSFLVDISDVADRKRDAISAYRSQFIANDANRGVAVRVESANRFLGSRIGTASAEAFFAREPLGLMSLDGLVR